RISQGKPPNDHRNMKHFRSIALPFHPVSDVKHLTSNIYIRNPLSSIYNITPTRLLKYINQFKSPVLFIS
ncbi:MAG: hypothetical protein ACLFPH_07690, partial [Bacteroidales bacterium]